MLLTLMLGAAATLATFSLVDALLLRPLGGVAQPEQLVRIAPADDRNELMRVTSIMRDSIRQLPAFAGVCGVNTPGGVVTTGDRVSFEGLLHVSGDCFTVLGARPLLGRLLTPDDERGRTPAAVITYDFWRREFGGRSDVVGQSVGIEGTPFTIVGVTEPAFRGLSTAFPSSIMVPITAVGRGSSSLYWSDVVARRAPGVSLEQARLQLETAWPQLKAGAGLTAKTSAATRQRFEGSRAFFAGMSTGIETVLRPKFERPLLLTFGLSVLMLVICCANVANLLAARSLARRSERAMRAALGASSGALLRQYVIEVLIPVVAGVLLAVPLAYALTVTLINVLRTSYIELELSGMWDLRVALFLATIVLVVTLATSLMHLFSVRRQRSLADALRTTAHTTTGRYGQLRRIMVVAQIAFCVVLVGSAARFVRTLQNYYHVDPGFAVDSTMAALLLPVPGTPSTADASYYDDLLRRLEAVPGVRSASVANWIPLGASFNDKVQRVPFTADEAPISAAIWSVSDRFFDSMGIELREGSQFRRTIRPSGSTGTAQAPAGAESGGGRTAILSESLAKNLFPDGNSIGAKVHVGADRNQDATVIGIVADARLAKPQESPIPVLYLNYWDNPQGSPYLFVRSATGRPEHLAETVRKEVRSGGRDFPLWTRTMSSQWEVALMQERLLAGTSAAFGGLGLLVAAIGLFGLLSYFVTSRKTEIGIRMALGAGRVQISRLFIREVAVCLVLGCVLGGILLFLISKVFAGLFVGVAPADVLLLSVAFGLIFVVTLVSVWIPLRRAISIDPLKALRTE
ncbi:MAG TPA: ABC transporter permease [Pyrinomonadaceae bacterium]|nr:ABC transporter permease [Pyrinomonadaceae bacterium]